MSTPIKYDPNFNVDDMLRVLGTINEKFTEGTPEDQALRVAAVSLLYIRHLEKLKDYRTYFEEFYLPATEVIKPSRSFSAREDAEQWLAGGTAARGEIVSINGMAHVVAQGSGGLMLVRTYLPHELEDDPPQNS